MVSSKSQKPSNDKAFILELSFTPETSSPVKSGQPLLTQDKPRSFDFSEKETPNRDGRRGNG